MSDLLVVQKAIIYYDVVCTLVYLFFKTYSFILVYTKSINITIIIQTHYRDYEQKR